MSYILDALKKAERARELTRVPTVTTVHSAARMGRRALLWAVAGGILAGGGATAWLLRAPPPVAVAPLKDDGGRRVGSHPDSTVESRRTARSSPPGTASPPPSAAARTPAPAEEPLESGDLTLPEPRTRSTHGPPRESSGPSSPREASETPEAADHRGAHLAVNVPGGTEPGPPPEAPPPTQVQAPPAEARVAIPPASPPGPASLREAIGKMTLTVLVYSEQKRDRVVYISGRRYVEGERVDGHYLVEEITPDGPILSYQGERALLGSPSRPLQHP